MDRMQGSRSLGLAQQATARRIRIVDPHDLHFVDDMDCPAFRDLHDDDNGVT